MGDVTILLRTTTEVRGLICKPHKQNNMSISMACQELYHSLGIMGRHLNGRPLCHPAGQDIPGQGSTQFAICSCHLPQTSSLNSLGDCKAQLPPDPRVIGYGALVVTKGKRAFSIDHFSTARLQWLSQA